MFLKRLLIFFKKIIYSIIFFILSPFLIIFNNDFRNRFYKSIYNFYNNFIYYFPLSSFLIILNKSHQNIHSFGLWYSFYIIFLMVFLFSIFNIILLNLLDLIYYFLISGKENERELTKEEYILSYFFSKELVLKIGKDKILKYFKLLCLIFYQIIAIYHLFLNKKQTKNYFFEIVTSFSFFFRNFLIIFMYFLIPYFFPFIFKIETILFSFLEKIKEEELYENNLKESNEFESYLNLFEKNMDFFICILISAFITFFLFMINLNLYNKKNKNDFIIFFQFEPIRLNIFLFVYFIFIIYIFYLGMLIIRTYKEIREE